MRLSSWPEPRDARRTGRSRRSWPGEPSGRRDSSVLRRTWDRGRGRSGPPGSPSGARDVRAWAWEGVLRFGLAGVTRSEEECVGGDHLLQPPRPRKVRHIPSPVAELPASLFRPCVFYSPFSWQFISHPAGRGGRLGGGGDWCGGEEWNGGPGSGPPFLRCYLRISSSSGARSGRWRFRISRIASGEADPTRTKPWTSFLSWSPSGWPFRSL